MTKTLPTLLTILDLILFRPIVGIVENLYRFLEADPMFAQVRRILGRVPFKLHTDTLQ